MNNAHGDGGFVRILDRITDAYVALGVDWRYTYVNATAAKLLGRRAEDLVGKHIWTEFPEEIGQPFHLAYEQAMAEQRPITLEAYYAPYDRWFENRIYPSPDGLTIYFQDVTGRKREQVFDAGQREILAGIAAQRPLAESLAGIARLHERLNPGALCSLLLIDAARAHLVHGAAPSLPEEYSRAIDGASIGAARGSCGTALWSGERVVVADISTHPFWAQYKQLALEHGLQACWSTPVLGQRGADDRHVCRLLQPATRAAAGRARGYRPDAERHRDRDRERCRPAPRPAFRWMLPRRGEHPADAPPIRSA